MDAELIVDSWTMPNTFHWQVDEADENNGIVDGVNILARAVGPAFLVDSASRNNRYYSRGLWESAITNTQSKVERGQMLGTIGHEQSLDDNALREGKASHRVSKIWIDEKQMIGMIECLVLNTSAGKELNAYLRGGVEFPVSSRAFGEYKGKMEDKDLINPDTFVLECFDFVRVPGVEAAIPRVVEHSTDDDPPTKPIPEKQEMTIDTNTLQRLSEEKANTQAELGRVLETNKALTAQSENLAGQTEAMSKELEQLRAAQASKDEELATLRDEAAAIKSQLAAYESLGTQDEISQTFQSSSAMAQRIASFGTVDEIDEVFNLVEGIRSSYGSVDNISAIAFLAEQYEELGSPEDITAVMDSFEKYARLGSPEDITRVMDVTQEYLKLGTPAEINAAFDQTEVFAETASKERRATTAASLSEDLGIEASLAETLLEKFDEGDARNLVEELGGSASSRTTRTKSVMSRFAVSENGDTGDDGLNESGKGKSSPTRAGRLFAAQ